ncbi:Dcp1p-Dcp2p decapping enzyme complex alpha subunit [Thecaphora frezii]
MAPAAHASTVPNLPGRKVEDHMQLTYLRNHVRDLCRLGHSRFPGAQPVSFDKNSIHLLTTEDYWVCEKSDGQRVLILIVIPSKTNVQEVFLIDRKNDYYQVPNLFFPHHLPRHPDAVKSGGMRKDTLMDGELVIDTDDDGRQKLVLLLFDLIVIDRELLAERPLSKRYGRLNTFIYPPYQKFLKQHPKLAAMQPFEVQVKKMDLSYGVGAVWNDVVPNLKHGNDGLIFTCLNSGYVMGTDPKILKWKPPSENSIDFKLSLRFPPDLERDPRGNLPDLTSMPFFELRQYMGSSASGEYEYFDELWVEPAEWATMVESGEQFDDRIVECVWETDPNPATELLREKQVQLPPRWRLMRIRDDKHHGNHCSIVEKILKSIRDGVEVDELLAAAPTIRAAWKSKQREDKRLGLPAASSSCNTAGDNQAGSAGAGGGGASAGGNLAYRGVRGKAPPLTNAAAAVGVVSGLVRR